jgi:hypothetical protein
MSVATISGMLRRHLRSCLDRLTSIANDLVACWIAQYSTGDTNIAQAATAALKWHAVVPADRVIVTVKRGWITLSGSVEWPHQKDAAAHALRHFIGVSGVTNDIRVQRPKSTTDVPNRVDVATRAAERQVARNDKQACRCSVRPTRRAADG